MTTIDTLTIVGMISAAVVAVLVFTLCAFDKGCNKPGC